MKITLKLLTTLLLAPLAVLHAAEKISNKPNIVFILADDLGWSDTSLYGTTKFLETPNIDLLAKRGMTFTNAYAANPLCSPTRASIMTGLYPARIGITTPCCNEPAVRLEAKLVEKAAPFQPALQVASASRLKTEYYTLAEALLDAGYTTGILANGTWARSRTVHSSRDSTWMCRIILVLDRPVQTLHPGVFRRNQTSRVSQANTSKTAWRARR